MKKLLLFLFTFSLVAILHAATATVNGITWTYQVSNGEAQIYNGAQSSAIPKSTSGAITIPSTLGGYPVTTIGYSAFYDCSGLTSVTIPSSVTSIGEGAFDGCTGLTSFVVDLNNLYFLAVNGLLCSKDGKTLVACPDGLTSVTIPSSVTSIGEHAFCECSSLTSVTIPEGVTSIGDCAFEYCSSLTSFVVDSTNQHYSVINNLLCSKDGKTLIACPGGLTSVTIPSRVTSIVDGAFSGCSSLTSVTIPEGVTSIENVTFGDCSSLTSVSIPSSVTSIGEGAFVGCSSLTSVSIPSSVTSIGFAAFYDCSSLTSVEFKGRPPSVGFVAFESISSSATGSYLPKYASEWEAVIESNGKWNGLTMTQKEGEKTFFVTLIAVGEGSVTGAGEYVVDETVTVTATPNAGYVFCGWSTTPVSMEATHSFTMPEEAVTLTAYFAPAAALNNYIAGQGFVSADDVDAKIQEYIADNNLKTPEEVEAAIEAHIASNGLLTPAQANQQTQDYIVANKLKSEQEVAAAIAQAIEEYVSSNGLLTPAEAEQQTQDYITANNLMSKEEAKQELLDADEVFTADEMKEMAFDTPVVEVKNDVIEIAISLQTAESLDAWQAMALQGATLEIDAQKGQVRVKVPKGDKKASFYKFVVPNEQ